MTIPTPVPTCRLPALLGVFLVVPAASAGPPPTEPRPVTDTYHGVAVSDPYRWLEQWPDAAVGAWTRAQNNHTRSFIDSRKNVAAIRAEVAGILNAGTVRYSGLATSGGRFFCIKHQPPKQQGFLVSFRSPFDLADERVLVDPERIDPGGATTIDWFKPSPDGSLVAVSLSRQGTEAGDLHFFEVATGKPVHEIVPRVNTGTAGGSAAWAADSTGVCYTRHPAPGEKPDKDLNFFQQAWFHKLGTDPGDDRYELGADFPRIAEIGFETHHPSGQLLLTVQDGDGGEFAHYLRTPDGNWRRFSRFGDRIVSATFSSDGRSLYLLSRAGAPRGKILRISARTLDLAAAGTVVPECEATLVTSFHAGSTILSARGRLYVVYQTGGPSEIRVFDSAGERLPAPAQLPVSSVGGLVATGGGDAVMFTSGSFITPPAWYRFDPQSGATRRTALRSDPPVDLEALGVRVVREFATSNDGTRVPVNILLPPGFDRGTDDPAPALVTGYGGYGLCVTPRFRPLNAVLLNQGVVLAVANLRGGGEFGDDWHRQGNLTNKQNVFDDFAAVLRHLIGRGYTTSDKLAIRGSSNGGLLMGALITQHPGLVRAAVSSVGIYDMLRFELSPNGSFNIPEFGTVTDPAQFRALHAYSPYHRVKDGTAYPATLLLTGVMDPRVGAMQSRKMAARLQAANSPDGAPILLRTSFDSGHGAGTPLAEKIAQEADVHAFLIDRLGIEFRAQSRIFSSSTSKTSMPAGAPAGGFSP